MKSISLPNWLRWILVLPAAVGAALAGAAMIKVMMIFAWRDDPNWYSNFLTSGGQAVASGLLFVLAGAYTAPPSRPDLLPIILAAVFVFISGGMAILALMRHDWMGLSVTAIGAGAAIGMAIYLQPPRYFR